jgi:hypothetical protein
MQIQASNKRRVVTVAAALTILTLTACGSGGRPGNAGQAGVGGVGTGAVASLPASPGQSPSAADTTKSGQSGPAGLDGVTMPDNASPSVLNRIEDAWASCMEAHGDHHFATKKDGAAGGYLTPTSGYSQFPAAVKACRSLQPHPPWQEMPQYNPDYQRDFARWVNCMNAEGVPVKAVPGGWDFNGTSSLSYAQQNRVTVTCEMRAFNEG